MRSGPITQLLKWVMRWTHARLCSGPCMQTIAYQMLPTIISLAAGFTRNLSNLPLAVYHQLTSTIATGTTIAKLSMIETVFSQVGMGACRR